MVKAIFIRYQSPLEEELCLKMLGNIQILILKAKIFGFSNLLDFLVNQSALDEEL